jgi:hypothetical protein
LKHRDLGIWACVAFQDACGGRAENESTTGRKVDRSLLVMPFLVSPLLIQFEAFGVFLSGTFSHYDFREKTKKRMGIGMYKGGADFDFLSLSPSLS